MSIVKLRDYMHSDVEVINGIRNDRDSLRLMNARYTKEESMEGSLEWMERQRQTSQFNIIEFDGDCAGFIKSRPTRFGDLSYEYEEIGIAISPMFRGKGIGKQAVTQFIESSPKDHFMARVIELNQHSHNLFKATGFHEIGKLSNVIDTPSDRHNSSSNLIFLVLKK